MGTRKSPERIVEGVKKAWNWKYPGLESDAFVDMAEWLAEETRRRDGKPP